MGFKSFNKSTPTTTIITTLIIKYIYMESNRERSYKQNEDFVYEGKIDAGNK